jgi:hypothetical protein
VRRTLFFKPTNRKEFRMTDNASLHVVFLQSSKFELGCLVATPNALNVLSHVDIVRGLFRHLRGDWGELDPEDRNANESALKHGGRLFSEYHSTNQVKFWIITECDRSATTVLLPEDY